MPSSLETLLERHLTLPELDYETLAEIPSGLLTAFGKVPDPRRAQGQRYRCDWLLAIMACTIMTGQTGFRQMCETARRMKNPRKLPIPRPSTFHRLLVRIDPRAFEEILIGWAATLQPNIDPLLAEALSLDGKELRSAKHGNGSKTMLFAACTHETGMTLGQVRVNKKSNEIKALPELLALLSKHYDLNNRVLTLDALHTQRAAATLITEEHGAHYVFTLKGNQPTLHTYIKDLPWEEVPVDDRTIDTSHGRVVIRELQLATLGPGVAPNWPGLRQVGKLTRERTHKNKTSIETVYILTSLPSYLAGPATIADLVRGHWSVENRLHHVRDTTFNEDKNQVRTGHGAQNLAALVNVTLNAFRHLNLTEIKPTSTALHAQNNLIQGILQAI